MPLVVAYDEIGPQQIKRNPGGPDRPASTSYSFFRATPDRAGDPSAFLAQYDPGDNSCTHFHTVDQFQILVKGRGQLGRHEVSPYHVHFARAYTPYGPLHADDEVGWTFMTLRTRYDPGAQRLPGALAKLQSVTGREPWQVTAPVPFADPGTGIGMRESPDLKDERGLSVRSIVMPAGTSMLAPPPSGGDGQYVVVIAGSLVHEDRERSALTVVFVRPHEDAFRIHAGPAGLEALILNFPRVEARTADKPGADSAAGFKKWQCVLCAFSYDEAEGLPEEGIAPGTRWADVPDDWNCPDCGAAKGDFEMVEVT